MIHPQATYALNHPITEWDKRLPPEHFILMPAVNLSMGISVDLILDGPHTQPMWHVSISYWYEGDRMLVIEWPKEAFENAENARDTVMYGCGDGDWKNSPEPEAHPRSVQWLKRLTSDEITKMGREK